MVNVRKVNVVVNMDGAERLMDIVTEKKDANLHMVDAINIMKNKMLMIHCVKEGIKMVSKDTIRKKIDTKFK